MKILTTPWKNDLLELVSNAKQSIKITSPFVKENICRQILEAKQSNSDFELITSFKLANIYSGSLDLSALDLILSNKGIVKNYSKLHSKVYLFDDAKAVITSGNLTNGGLVSNYEYGILLDDKEIVSNISYDFKALSNDEKTGTVKAVDLIAVRNILTNIPKKETLRLPVYTLETDSPEQVGDIIKLPIVAITKELKGWKLAVFNCLNSLPQQLFTISDAYSFENILRNKYPSNNNVRDKVRQQLQYLRDLGLVEFMGSGQYKKLWK